MELARSTYYDERKGQPIEEARAEFPRYGYRRVAAQLREDGIVVNHKKVMRLMKEHGLTVQPRRRYVVTTDSDHGGPVFPDLAKEVTPTGPNQLWVADITYIAIARGFVYLEVGSRVDDGLEVMAAPQAKGKRAMTTYIVLVNWTERGMQEVKKSPQRLDAAKKMLKQMGGEIKSVYMTMGEYDLVVVCEASDDAVAARFALQLGMLGNVRTQTLKAFPEAAYREIIASLG